MTKFIRIAAVTAIVLVPARADALVSSQLFQSGFSRPIFLTHAPGEPDRVYVVEQNGFIKIVEGGSTLPVPFLDLTVESVCCNERGLLGLAFHPNYQSNGYFYVNYTRTGDGATVISRFIVSANPDSADENSEVILLTVSQPEPNHNGGCLQFGPDGMLYCGMGDGGGSNDQHGPIGNGQYPLTLLGKMIRLDVDAGPPYVPGDNPWAGVQAGEDTLDLIWSLGVRNPWRFSFDRMTGDMYIGDVGQNSREEVSYQSAASSGGENFGWRCMEADECTGMTGCTCFETSLTDPIHAYENGDSAECAVTGGYVYHGCAAPELDGWYLFGDYCTARIWAIRHNGLSSTDTLELTDELNSTGQVGLLSSFGEDAYGNVYLIDLLGDIHKIVSDQSNCADCDCPYQADMNGDGFLDAVDLNDVIDALFFGGPDLQDPMCPVTRADFNADGQPDATDLNALIDVLFFGGPMPTDPCIP